MDTCENCQKPINVETDPHKLVFIDRCYNTGPIHMSCWEKLFKSTEEKADSTIVREKVDG